MAEKYEEIVVLEIDHVSHDNVSIGETRKSKEGLLPEEIKERAERGGRKNQRTERKDQQRYCCAFCPNVSHNSCIERDGYCL